MSLKQIVSLPWAYMKRSKGEPLPICFLIYKVTWNCNSKCRMCNIWKTPIKDQELTSEEVREFFASPLLSQLNFLNISGGEIFLKPDLADIIRVISQSHPNLTIHLATNGFLTDRIVETMKEATKYNNNLVVGVSVDGIGETHDYLRGVKNAFKMALETINALEELRVKFNLSLTVMPYNFKEISSVRQLAISHNASFSFQIVESQDSHYRNVSNPEIQWTNKTKQEMKEFIYDVSRREKWFDGNQRLWNAVEKFQFNSGFKHVERPGKQIIPCFSGIHSLMLDPFGEIFPCIIYNRSMGNIRDSSFEEIWFSEKAKAIRKSGVKGNCPACWLNCENQWSIYKSPHKVIRYLIR